MKNALRSLAVVAALALTAAPAMQAERTGCNPHPQAVSVPAPSTFALIVYTVILGVTGA